MQKVRTAIVLGVALLMGCATAGNEFDSSAVDHLKVGVSTYDDAIALLGKPSTVGSHSDGTKVALWTWASCTAISNCESRAAKVKFDAQGKVMEFAKSEKQK